MHLNKRNNVYGLTIKFLFKLFPIENLILNLLLILNFLLKINEEKYLLYDAWKILQQLCKSEVL